MGRLGAKEDLRTGQANHGGMLIFGRSRAILPSAPEGLAEGALGYSCDHPNHELSREPVPLRSRLIAMTDDEFVTYKAERYDAQLKYYDQKAVRNRRCYNILSVYVILASLAVSPSITVPNCRVRYCTLRTLLIPRELAESPRELGPTQARVVLARRQSGPIRRRRRPK